METLTTWEQEYFGPKDYCIASSFEKLMVKNEEEFYTKVEQVLKSEMIVRKKVCTLLEFVVETDREESYSIPVAEDYSYEQLLQRLEQIRCSQKAKAVRMRFEPYYLSDEKTWIIIVCSNWQ